ncbi:hypothetical protein V8F20_010284 [Naviculisporaceae sp. PSN 640]
MEAAGEQHPVYLGVWTNWSRGPVMGMTLTITRSNANLLIAFVAFYVAFVGRRFWRIFCFACHSIVSSRSGRPREGTYHQHQLVMRNAETATSGVVALIQVLWAWRTTKGRPVGLLVITLALATLCSVTSIVASGFSSRLSSLPGDEVLIRGRRCGFIAETRENLDSYASVYSPYISKMFVNAANYAQECYGKNQSGLLGCNTFVKKSLPFTVDTNATCPFDPALCKSQTGNIRLDTGLLDSHDDIGLNAKPENRVLWRKTLHCAPLVTEGYKSEHNQSIDGKTPKPMVRYHYGKWAALSPDSRDNYTYEYVNDPLWEYNISAPDASYNLYSTAAYSDGDELVPSTGGYQIEGTLAPVGFTPIPELRSVYPQADIAILFLSSNNMPYMRPTNDPWYSATTPFRTLSHMDYNTTSQITYLQDEPSSPLGCVEQRQFCTPRRKAADGTSPLCTPLVGIFDIPYVTEPLIPGEDDPDFEPGELNYFKWFYNLWITPQDTINHAISFLHATALQSRFSISRNTQGPLPDNQWQLEVQHLFSTLLSSIQQAFVHAANVPEVPGLDEFIIGPGSDQSDNLCLNQKIRSNAYASFSFFGLLFISILGLVIIVVSYCLEPIAGCFHRRGKYNSYAYYEWVSNSTFQLQRLAHQGVGAGEWSGATDDIPITRAGDRLAVLDLKEDGGLTELRCVGGEMDEKIDLNGRTLTHASTLVADGGNKSRKGLREKILEVGKNGSVEDEFYVSPSSTIKVEARERV